MKALKLAIIGCGGIVRKVHSGNLKNMPNVTVHACMDLSEEAASAMARQLGAAYHCTDANRVMNDPEIEAVLIATHPGSHVPLSIQAAQAGKAIFCEKPATAGLADGLKLRKVLGETRARYMTGYCYRFNKAVAAIHPHLRPDFSFAHVMAPPGERQDLSFHLRENLCHAIDLTCYFHRSDPVSARAQTSGALMSINDSKARLAVTLRFPDGSLCVMIAGARAASPFFGKWYYKFCADDRVAEVVNYRKSRLRGLNETDFSVDFDDEAAYYSGHKLELELFAEAALSGKPMPISFEEGFRTDLIVDAIQLSAETDKEVVIDYHR